MLISKQQRLAVYVKLFEDGVFVCAKDVHKPKHNEVEVPNLECMKLMKSLTSRGYVKETFNWQWLYYSLTPEGVEYLRGFLHLPAELVPETHKAPARPDRPTGERAPREGGMGRGRRERGERDGGYRREGGVGRGAPRE